jgi:hypothetical protein
MAMLGVTWTTNRVDAAWRALVVGGIALVVAACPAATIAPSSSVASQTFVAEATTPAPASTATPIPTSTPSPSPAPTPTPTLDPASLCRASDLKATIALWTANPGVVHGHVVVTNSSGSPCYLHGQAEAQMVDSVGGIVADSGASSAIIDPADPFYVLRPGDQIRTTVDWSNWCPKGPTQPVTIALILPLDLGRVVSKPRGGHTPIPTCTGAHETKVSPARWTP